jgi:hypothetical protein
MDLALMRNVLLLQFRELNTFGISAIGLAQQQQSPFSIGMTLAKPLVTLLSCQLLQD